MHITGSNSCSECCYSTAICSVAGNSNSSGDRNYDNTHGSFVASKNEIFYHTFMLNNVDEENQVDSSGGKDNEEDESGTSKTEDLEVRMDLTDDLLHMVCVCLTFLPSKRKCLITSAPKFCICLYLSFYSLLSGLLFLGSHKSLPSCYSLQAVACGQCS